MALRPAERGYARCFLFSCGLVARLPLPLKGVRPFQSRCGRYSKSIFGKARVRSGSALSFGVGLKREEKDMANSIVLFESADREVQLSVELDKKTVWLSQEQMADLFGRSVSVVSRHIGNAIREGEISAESNLQKMQNMRSDGGLTLYDLDVVISVGYRVKSQRGVEFRRSTPASRRMKIYIEAGPSEKGLGNI